MPKISATHSLSKRRTLCAAALCALLSLGAASAQTRTPESAATPAMLEAIENLVASQAAEQGSLSLSVGRIAPNARIAECRQWQAFLPNNQSLRRRMSIGLRCQAGSNLSLFVPVSIEMQGQYITLAHSIQGGQVIAKKDLVSTAGDLASLPADVITNQADAIGQTARQALSAKQPLRRIHLQQALAIQAGQTVKIISQGAGFSVSNEGRAMANAAEGQMVRVRLTNNQIMDGIARQGGIVEITP